MFFFACSLPYFPLFHSLHLSQVPQSLPSVRFLRSRPSAPSVPQAHHFQGLQFHQLPREVPEDLLDLRGPLGLGPRGHLWLLFHQFLPDLPEMTPGFIVKSASVQLQSCRQIFSSELYICLRLRHPSSFRGIRPLLLFFPIVSSMFRPVFAQQKWFHP